MGFFRRRKKNVEDRPDAPEAAGAEASDAEPAGSKTESLEGARAEPGAASQIKDLETAAAATEAAATEAAATEAAATEAAAAEPDGQPEHAGAKTADPAAGPVPGRPSDAGATAGVSAVDAATDAGVVGGGADRPVGQGDAPAPDAGGMDGEAADHASLARTGGGADPLPGAADPATGSRARLRDAEEELSALSRKMQSVKDEYGVSVRGLMEIKKTLNQKRDELDVASIQLEKLKKEISEHRQLESKAAESLEKRRKELEETGAGIKQVREEQSALEEKMTRERHALSVIMTQKSETTKELEEANARLYNAKEELANRERFQDTSILTATEKGLLGESLGDAPAHSEAAGDAGGAGASSPKIAAPGGTEGSLRHASVVEAASAVVASLKSRLTTTQRELEDVQSLLEREREQHDMTKQQLDKLRKAQGDLQE